MMNLNEKLLASYWLIIGVISGIFYLFDRNIIIIIFPQILMIFSSIYPGNIFFVKRTFDIKKFILFLIIFISIFYIETILDFKSFIPLNYINYIITTFSVTTAIVILLKESAGISLTCLLSNLNIVQKSFLSYILKFKKGTVFGMLVEILLICVLINAPIDVFGKSLIIIFWIISAYFFVLLRLTSFVLKENIKHILVICKIYGLTRLTFWLLPFYAFQITLNWITFSYLFSMMYLTFMSDLVPYITNSRELKDSINILRYLSIDKERKINQIVRDLKLKDMNYAEEILNGLHSRGFVCSEKYKKWSLSKYYTFMIT